MEADPALFRDLTYIFLAATAGGFLAWRLGLPLVSRIADFNSANCL
jgi:hypothetical protein